MNTKATQTSFSKLHFPTLPPLRLWPARKETAHKMGVSWLEVLHASIVIHLARERTQRTRAETKKAVRIILREEPQRQDAKSCGSLEMDEEGPPGPLLCRAAQSSVGSFLHGLLRPRFLSGERGCRI